jgi:hypothetical protein
LLLLDFGLLNKILVSDSLLTESGDWLLELITNLGDEYSGFLEQLHFEFLSASGITKFARVYGFQMVTEAIWDSKRIWSKDCDMRSGEGCKYGKWPLEYTWSDKRLAM